MDISLKSYTKKMEYSYASGVFATLELLKHRPNKVLRVFISSKGEQNKGLDEIKNLCEINNIKVETANSLVIRLSKSENCYSVGVFEKYEDKILEEDNHIVLINPSDMGNVGTTLRTMVGFDITNLALIKPCVDIFDPKVVRSSTGAIFQAKITHFSNFGEYYNKTKHHLYAFTLDKYANKVEKNLFVKPYSLIFGNEGAGIDEKILRSHGLEKVYIDHKNTIDSLNLSVATGLGIFFATRSK